MRTYVIYVSTLCKYVIYVCCVVMLCYACMEAKYVYMCFVIYARCLLFAMYVGHVCNVALCNEPCTCVCILCLYGMYVCYVRALCKRYVCYARMICRLCMYVRYVCYVCAYVMYALHVIYLCMYVTYVYVVYVRFFCACM